MKSVRLLLVGLAAGLASLAFNGCSSTPNSTVSTLGPVIVQVAQAHIVDAILDRDPSAEPKLQAVADALDAIKDSATVNEITEAAIRGFVASNSEKWGLMSADEELLIASLLLARDQYISTTGVGVVLSNDPQVGVWIAALKQGIESGLAAHRAK